MDHEEVRQEAMALCETLGECQVEGNRLFVQLCEAEQVNIILENQKYVIEHELLVATGTMEDLRLDLNDARAQLVYANHALKQERKKTSLLEKMLLRETDQASKDRAELSKYRRMEAEGFFETIRSGAHKLRNKFASRRRRANSDGSLERRSARASWTSGLSKKSASCSDLPAQAQRSQSSNSVPSWWKSNW